MSRKKECLEKISRKIDCQKKQIKKKENWFKPKHPGNSFSVQLALHSLTVHGRTGTFFSGSFSPVATGGHYESSVREVNSKFLTWGKLKTKVRCVNRVRYN